MELIERFEVFTISVTKAYKCIQKIKLAESERKYRTKIMLTPEGIEINKQMNEAIAIGVSKSSSSLNEDERENFYRVFFHITDNLETICSSYRQGK